MYIACRYFSRIHFTVLSLRHIAASVHLQKPPDTCFILPVQLRTKMFLLVRSSIVRWKRIKKKDPRQKYRDRCAFAIRSGPVKFFRPVAPLKSKIHDITSLIKAEVGSDLRAHLQRSATTIRYSRLYRLVRVNNFKR